MNSYCFTVSAMIFNWVSSGNRLPLDRIPPDVPKEIHNLITACWDQEPSKRPSFSGNHFVTE